MGVPRFIQYLSAVILAAGSVSAQAGLIQFLRGNPPETKRDFRRVAFVGCAEVKSVRGEAERLAGIHRWRKLEVGMQLRPGDLVRTRDGEAVLKMRDSQSFVKVCPHTMLRLVEFEPGWDQAILSGREELKGFVVRSRRGMAYCRTESDPRWRLVQVNSVLAEGTLLKTASGAMVDLFSTQNHRPARIGPLTETKLSHAAFASRKGHSPLIASAQDQHRPDSRHAP